VNRNIDFNLHGMLIQREIWGLVRELSLKRHFVSPLLGFPKKNAAPQLNVERHL